MLEEHLVLLEEAKKRDHRKLGRELELFTFSQRVGQGLPLWFIARFGVRRRLALCTLSAAFFGVLHLPAGLGGWVIGFTSGLVLSYCWLSWRVMSRGAAFWRTTAVHSVHNAVALPLYMIGEAFS